MGGGRAASCCHISCSLQPCWAPAHGIRVGTRRNSTAYPPFPPSVRSFTSFRHGTSPPTAWREVLKTCPSIFPFSNDDGLPSKRLKTTMDMSTHPTSPSYHLHGNTTGRVGGQGLWQLQNKKLSRVVATFLLPGVEATAGSSRESASLLAAPPCPPHSCSALFTPLHLPPLTSRKSQGHLSPTPWYWALSLSCHQPTALLYV